MSMKVVVFNYQKSDDLPVEKKRILKMNEINGMIGGLDINKMSTEELDNMEEAVAVLSALEKKYYRNYRTDRIV